MSVKDDYESGGGHDLKADLQPIRFGSVRFGSERVISFYHQGYLIRERACQHDRNTTQQHIIKESHPRTFERGQHLFFVW